MAEREEELKSLLMRVKEESEKAGLKLSIKNNKINVIPDFVSALDCKVWVPWTSRRSNQSILKEINPEYSLEGLTLKLKLQYFGHLMRRGDSLGKTLMLGKIESRRRRRQQRMRWLDGIISSVSWVWENSGRYGKIGKHGMLQFIWSQRIRQWQQLKNKVCLCVCLVVIVLFYYRKQTTS